MSIHIDFSGEDSAPQLSLKSAITLADECLAEKSPRLAVTKQLRQTFRDGADMATRSYSMQRYWINQPSTLQKHHDLHGQNVLAAPTHGAFVRVYFASGDVISMEIDKAALSAGWRK